MQESPDDLVSRLRRMTRVMTVDEVAELLSVSKQLIYKLRSNGRIPSLRVAGAIRFDPVELACWLDDRRRPPMSIRR